MVTLHENTSHYSVCEYHDIMTTTPSLYNSKNTVTVSLMIRVNEKEAYPETSSVFTVKLITEISSVIIRDW